MKLYKELILNGADPVLADNLIPVEIDNTGKVTKANIANAWYSYKEKRWANAVILTGSDTYNAGDTIPESAIESYFVWIPKYSYQIQTLGNSSNTSKKPFEIKFGTTNTSDSKSGECTTPTASNASGSSGNCAVGDYMTHPAFLHFKDGIKGLWVGKFETGYKGATSTSTAQVDETNASKVQIKPNVYSWRSITVSNMHNTAIGYKSTLNSHMMKNTEWGAVAYLYHSIYGRCTGTSCEEVYNNNNSNYITGWSGTTASASLSTTSGYTYTNTNSTKASTTGNYSGIYDMSGGAYEYVMGNYSAAKGSSGFSTMPDAKYYDKYTNNSNSTSSTRRILGDATAETRAWYSDSTWFVNSTGEVWFVRGGGTGTISNDGVFGFLDRFGKADKSHGFRIVLAV